MGRSDPTNTYRTSLLWPDYLSHKTLTTLRNLHHRHGLGGQPKVRPLRGAGVRWPYWSGGRGPWDGPEGRSIQSPVTSGPPGHQARPRPPGPAEGLKLGLGRARSKNTNGTEITATQLTFSYEQHMIKSGPALLVLGTSAGSLGILNIQNFG